MSDQLSAEERARECWKQFPCDTSEPEEQIDFIAAQIRAAEEAERNRVITAGGIIAKDVYDKGEREGYRRGIRDAAEIAKKFSPKLAERIRGLAGSAGIKS
jgi:sugar phosphate isomerase/epimerase